MNKHKTLQYDRGLRNSTESAPEATFLEAEGTKPSSATKRGDCSTVTAGGTQAKGSSTRYARCAVLPAQHQQQHYDLKSAGVCFCVCCGRAAVKFPDGFGSNGSMLTCDVSRAHSAQTLPHGLGGEIEVGDFFVTAQANLLQVNYART